jgi:hypothetical protein
MPKRTGAEPDHIENGNNNQREDCYKEQPAIIVTAKALKSIQEGLGAKRCAKPDLNCCLRNPLDARKSLPPQASKMLEGWA